MNPAPDPALWLRLSPRLDELLELPPPARAARLAALREEDAALAEALAAMLDGLPSLEAEGFLEAPAMPRPAGLAGQSVGAYVLQREIGQGGMGSVWLAQRADGRYQGQAAIKFMRHGLASAAAAERFLREGQLLARLDHPHIARLLDAGVRQAPGTPAGQPYLVLEFVAGQPIDVHCDQHGLDDTARVRLMLAVLDAVAHAHSRLILHRDLKPSNILVTPDGRPKLLDFGVGKLLADAEAIGDGAAQAGASGPAAQAATAFTQLAYTERFAAPEQLQHQELTTATDVYALGVLLYELLGGGHPTEPPEATPLARLQALVHTVPRPLSEAVRERGGPAAARRARALRGDMDTILARALKKQPAERYANAAALADDLRRWLDHEPVLARRDTVGYRVGRFMRRHARVLAAAAGAGSLALAGGAALALWQAQQARHERSQAEGLVAFMLGDLQARLNQIGRPDLLQAVGERALAYYGAEDLQALDDEALAQRARALRAIGEGARLRLDRAQARHAFDQAADTTARLLTRAPQDTARLQEHARSLERLVELSSDGGASDDGVAWARQISALYRQAAAAAPQDLALRLQSVVGDQWLIALLDGRTSSAELRRLIAEGHAVLRTLPPGLANLARVRAVHLGLEGQVLSAEGRYAEAEARFQSFLTQQPAGPQALTNLVERRENRLMLRELAAVVLAQGRLAEAQGFARQATDLLAEDSRLGQDNRTVAEEEIRCHALLAELARLAGDLGQARRHLQHAEAVLARVGDMSASQASWHLVTAAQVLMLRAQLQLPGHAPDAPLMAALQAHEDRLAEAERQGSRLFGSMLRTAFAIGLAHGDAWQAQGRPAQARQQWQAVVRRARPEAQAGSHHAMQALAQALQRLGEPAEARAWVDRLRASTWRHPELALLSQALKHRQSPTGPRAGA